MFSGPVWKLVEFLSALDNTTSLAEWFDSPVFSTFIKYGWLVTIPLGSLFWWLNRQPTVLISPTTASRIRNAVVGITIGVSAFILGANWTVPPYSGLGPSTPYSWYIASWGGVGDAVLSRLHVTASSYYLRSKRNKYHLGAVAFHYFADSDMRDARGLQKSGLHDIEDHDVDMTINLDKDFLLSVSRGSINTSYVLLLVPKGITMDQFDTLRQAEGMGVIFVQYAAGPP